VALAWVGGGADGREANRSSVRSVKESPQDTGSIMPRMCRPANKRDGKSNGNDGSNSPASCIFEDVDRHATNGHSLARSPPLSSATELRRAHRHTHSHTASPPPAPLTPAPSPPSRPMHPPLSLCILTLSAARPPSRRLSAYLAVSGFALVVLAPVDSRAALRRRSRRQA
jgi:hypothetical protein